ncbi:MAG: pyridoxal phosphate-dependent aminotransferase [Butyrivibrio sp.]|nr:pyridoxal phosphate-dependent aminotransferase [Butyrivibrio sp.]
MGQYDFDTYIDRRGTSCIKWDFGMERKGRDDLLPLWVADMDFKLPDEIVSDITNRASQGVFGYTDPKADYFDAVNGWFERRHGFKVDHDWITITHGVVYGIVLAIRAFTEPGEAVMIQQPVYYPFAESVRVNKRKLVNNQLVYKDGKYEIDFDDFEKKIVEEKVKLFLLCSPHNPVGRVWSRDELIRIADICKRHDVYVFADEIHSDFIYSSFAHTSYMTLGDGYRDKLILGTSPSKTFNMAGLQVANIIIPNRDVREKFRYENMITGYSQCNAVGLEATKSVYTKGDKWVDELIEYLEGNLSFVRDFLKEKLPKVKLVEPEGTYLIWLDFSKITDSHKELEDLIVDKAHLWLDPGIIFGKETSLFERINIACPRSILKQAMEQLYEAISNADSKI